MGLVRWSKRVKMLACKAWWAELEQQDLNGEKRVQTPTGCPPASVCAPWHTHK